MGKELGILVLAGIGAIGYMLLTGTGPEKILAQAGEIPKKMETGVRGLEVTLAARGESLGRVEAASPVIAEPDRFNGGNAVWNPTAQIGPYDYLKAKYPLVKKWDPSGAPVVEFYSGQSPQEKAQIKAAYKEYDRLKRAKAEGYESITEWQQARWKEELKRRPPMSVYQTRQETGEPEIRGVAIGINEPVEMTQRERIKMKQELGEPLTLQERLATLPGGLTPEETIRGPEGVTSPASSLIGFVKSAFRVA